MTAFCSCYENKPKTENKILVLLGNSEELLNTVYNKIIQKQLNFPESEFSITTPFKYNKNKINLVSFKHSDDTMLTKVANITINYANGVILVIDAQKDHEEIRKYLQLLNKSEDSRNIKGTQSLFLISNENEDLIDEIQEFDPSFYATEPVDSWFKKDSEVNVFKFISSL